MPGIGGKRSWGRGTLPWERWKRISPFLFFLSPFPFFVTVRLFRLFPSLPV